MKQKIFKRSALSALILATSFGVLGGGQKSKAELMQPSNIMYVVEVNSGGVNNRETDVTLTGLKRKVEPVKDYEHITEVGNLDRFGFTYKDENGENVYVLLGGNLELWKEGGNIASLSMDFAKNMGVKYTGIKREPYEEPNERFLISDGLSLEKVKNERLEGNFEIADKEVLLNESDLESFNNKKYNPNDPDTEKYLKTARNRVNSHMEDRVVLKAITDINKDYTGNGLTVTKSDAKDKNEFTIDLNIGKGLKFDDDKKLVNDLKISGVDLIKVTGNAKDGYIIGTNGLLTPTNDNHPTAGSGLELTPQTDGPAVYNVKLGKGLEFDSNGNIENNLVLRAGNNVEITGNAKEGYVINMGSTLNSAGGNGPANLINRIKVITDSGEKEVSNEFSIVGGDNISTSFTEDGKMKISLNKEMSFDEVETKSVEIAESDIAITKDGINAGNQVVSNVKDGVNDNDAVNVGQLKKATQFINNLESNFNRVENAINRVEAQVRKNEKRSRARTAGVAAMANMPQVFKAGANGFGAAVGHSAGETALAVGFSSASDNGKHVIKFSTGLDTQKQMSVGAGYMFMF